MKTAQQVAQPRSRLVAALCGWHLFCVAVSYAIVGDAPLFPALVLTVSVAALLPRHGAEVSLRFFAYSVTFAALFTVVLNSVYPVDGDRFFVPISTELAFPVVMTIACAMLFLEQRASILAGILAMGLSLFMLQGATVNDPTDHVRLALPAEGFWSDRFRLFAVITALQIPALLGILHHARRTPASATARPPASRSTLPFLAATLVLVVVTISSSWLMQRYFRVFDSFAQDLLRSQRQQRSVIFDKTVDLNRTVDEKRGARASQTVFLVNAPQPPGYLRGFSYEHYADGQWQSTDAKQLVEPQKDPGIASSRFALREAPATDDAAPITFDLYPDKAFRSAAVLIPGNALELEIIADSVSITSQGTINARNDKDSAGWRVSVPKMNQAAAWPAPEPKPADELLAVPANLQAALAPLLQEALRGAPARQDLRIRHVADWVRERCDYELGVELPDDRDPVLGFLVDVRRGHCELYATATVLLLRTAGIPARYVTGYFSTSPAGRSNWYAGRRTDCHAWLEAWDGDQWVLVEPTPASGVPAVNRADFAEALRLAVASAFRDLMANLERGYFAAAVTALLKAAGNAVVWLFFGGPWYLSWPLTLALAWFAHRRWFQHHGQGNLASNRERLELQAAIRPLLRKLENQGIPRPATTTIQQLSRKVAAASFPQSTSCIELLQRYERLRYGPESPGQDIIATLARDARNIRLR